MNPVHRAGAALLSSSGGIGTAGVLLFPLGRFEIAVVVVGLAAVLAAVAAVLLARPCPPVRPCPRLVDAGRTWAACTGLDGHTGRHR